MRARNVAFTLDDRAVETKSIIKATTLDRQKGRDMAFISEINFRGGGIQSNDEFVEVTLGPNDDPANFAVSLYDHNGYLHEGSGLPGGEVTLDELVGVPHPDNPDFTIYVIPAGIRDSTSDANEATGVALTDTSNGNVLNFFSASRLPPIEANEGAGNGATSDNLLNYTSFPQGHSPKWDIDGNYSTSAIGKGNSLICFVAGTSIEGAEGSRCVEQLELGSMVKTENGDFQVITAIYKQAFSRKQLLMDERLRPVRITVGSLGAGLPKRDLLVSRQHRIKLQSRTLSRVTGYSEVLIAAVRLTKLPGIYLEPDFGDVEYYHIELNQHEIVYAEGTPVESYLPDSEEQYDLVKLNSLPGEVARKQSTAAFVPSSRKQNKAITKLIEKGKFGITS